MNSRRFFCAHGHAALSMVAAICVSACSTLPPPVSEPAITIPAEWAGAETATASPDLARYWTRFEDALLTDLVESAIAQNRDLTIGIARLDQARAGLRTARAGYFPTISGSAGARRDVGDFADDDLQFTIGADAAWEVDLFGQISGNVVASRAELLAAGYSLADIQRLIVGQVAIQAIAARALSEQLAIARSSLAFQDDNLQLARWRNQAGLVSSLDVEQARTQRAQTAASIPLLDSNLAATANAISTLIGEPPGRVLDAFRASEPEPVPVPPQIDGFAAPAEVLSRRPDVRAAEADVIASSARIGVARADLLPSLGLTGSIGAGGSPLSDLFDLVTGNLFAGLTQMIFDGGRTAARVDNAEAIARASLASYEQSILRALEEVESSATDQRTAAERVAISEEAVDAAENSAFLARSQYEAGLTDFQTLLVVESQLLSARNQLVGAQADRATAFVRLTQALGGGWSETNYNLPIPGATPRQDDRTAQ